MKYFTLLLLLGFSLLQSCNTQLGDGKVTNEKDYNSYLLSNANEAFKEASAQRDFWSARLRPDSSGVGDLMPLAAAYEQLFDATGNINYIYDAEKLYKKGFALSANNKDGFARGLAHNYISQHRFQESYTLLQETYEGISNKHQTQLILFDAAMEMGDYEKAYEYLNAIKDLSDYNYLIRLSKWSDHRGDLDAAIKFMEDARTLAEAKGSIPLKIWTYSNLGDYYGHAGRIADSYSYYLKTLQLQPSNTHVKKGIAWIVYAHENNTTEAHRILDKALKDYQLPDGYLLQQELFEYDGFSAKAALAQKNFLEAVENGNYGAMYNAYLIPIYAELAPEKAVKLAQVEVDRRPTPESYHLLALALVKNNQNKAALSVIKEKVQGKTFEPMALYHSAMVFKANGLTLELAPIKEELLDASFELGPLLMKKIEAL